MHPRLITAKRLFVKTVTKTLWSSGLKQSSHYQRWWGSSGLSFNLLFFIFLPTAFLTETTFVTVVYSSYLIHREALRIKPYNTVTLLWVHKNIKKKQKTKKKHTNCSEETSFGTAATEIHTYSWHTNMQPIVSGCTRAAICRSSCT